jgi:hypothetical protein
VSICWWAAFSSNTARSTASRTSAPAVTIPWLTSRQAGRSPIVPATSRAISLETINSAVHV